MVSWPDIYKDSKIIVWDMIFESFFMPEPNKLSEHMFTEEEKCGILFYIMRTYVLKGCECGEFMECRFE